MRCHSVTNKIKKTEGLFCRNYVSFDIIKRILEDYFNYDVFSVMNITDVDDKIILRARKNYLLAQYEKDNATLSKSVLEDVAQALNDFKEDMAKKIQELESEIADLAKRKKVNKEFEKKAEKQLLQEKLDQAPMLESKLDELAKIESLTTPSAELLAVAPAREVLAELLDKRHGAGVTDEKIFRAHAACYEEEFMEDMKKLGVRVPDVLTRVTEYIPEIISFVEKIIQQGLAYETHGSVYFDTTEFVHRGFDYGKLEPWSVGDAKLLSSGEGALSTIEAKKSSNDFALWKKSKPGEPSWDSPWGKGRPGWHIECSAMASDLFGGNMDIHSGGSDLRFPHHDNEIAQAEAHFCNKQWVNYFLHSGEEVHQLYLSVLSLTYTFLCTCVLGHLHINGLKMSKSLKNFITIRDVLAEHTARQVRLYFVNQSWWNVMDYDRKSGMIEIKNKENTICRFFESAQQLWIEEQASGSVHNTQKWGEEDKILHRAFLQAQEGVHQALLDNFDTPRAMKHLYDTVRATNTYIDKSKEAQYKPRALLIHKVAVYVARILSVFGIEFPEYGHGASASTSEATAKDKLYLDALAGFRQQVLSPFTLAYMGSPCVFFLSV